MSQKYTLIPMIMPNTISVDIGNLPGLIQVSDLTNEEAIEYGELLKQTFINHHDKLIKEANRLTVTEISNYHLRDSNQKFVGSCKALTYENMFVNVNLLYDGIYFTNTPELYSKDTTMEELKERIKWTIKIMDHSSFSEAYFENLLKCELTELQLSFIN